VADISENRVSNIMRTLDIDLRSPVALDDANDATSGLSIGVGNTFWLLRLKNFLFCGCLEVVIFFVRFIRVVVLQGSWSLSVSNMDEKHKIKHLLS
jgi:hypothetical protein